MKKVKHFHQRSVKVGGGYGKIKTVTVCGKQEKMSRLTLAERIIIECGIYQKLKLSEIARKHHIFRNGTLAVPYDIIHQFVR